MNNQKIARELVRLARELTAGGDFEREIKENIRRIKKTLSMKDTWQEGYIENLKEQLKFYEGELRKLK